MGSCVNKDKMPNDNIRPQAGHAHSSRDTGLGIQIVPGARSTVKFNHSPLSSCPFLLQKFTQSANRPQEANLSFMILGVEVNQSAKSVTISYINQNEVNMYLIVGGQQSISNTGLTVNVANAIFVEKVNRRTPTPVQGNKITIVASKLVQENFMVVMEPILKVSQSMYLIHKYVWDQKQKKHKKKHQSLQWSSLAFNLQDIYGAENQFKCDADETCTVCLSSPANVILTPCRHMCICNLCAKSYEKSSNKCPICRSEFRAFIVY